MGVSGCGKSTVAKLIAEQLDGEFLDADDLHPRHNIELMAKGVPLTDQDRFPWLNIVRDYAISAIDHPKPLVIACSALKRKYRDILSDAPDTRYVFLKGEKSLIRDRMKNRSEHFMPESLLDSQFNALESPENEPNTVTVLINCEPSIVAKNAIQSLLQANYI